MKNYLLVLLSFLCITGLSAQSKKVFQQNFLKGKTLFDNQDYETENLPGIEPSFLTLGSDHKNKYQIFARNNGLALVLETCHCDGT